MTFTVWFKNLKLSSPTFSIQRGVFLLTPPNQNSFSSTFLLVDVHGATPNYYIISFINSSVVSFLFSCCCILLWSKFGGLGLLICLMSLLCHSLFCFFSDELNLWGNLWYELLQFCKTEFHTLQTKSKPRVKQICIFICLFDQSSGSVLTLLL